MRRRPPVFFDIFFTIFFNSLSPNFGNSINFKFFSALKLLILATSLIEASIKDVAKINNFKALKNLKFIEFPKLGLNELKKIVKKISKNTGGLLLIHYGY